MPTDIWSFVSSVGKSFVFLNKRFRPKGETTRDNRKIHNINTDSDNFSLKATFFKYNL